MSGERNPLPVVVLHSVSRNGLLLIKAWLSCLNKRKKHKEILALLAWKKERKCSRRMKSPHWPNEHCFFAGCKLNFFLVKGIFVPVYFCFSGEDLLLGWIKIWEALFWISFATDCMTRPHLKGVSSARANNTFFSSNWARTNIQSVWWMESWVET